MAGELLQSGFEKERDMTEQKKSGQIGFKVSEKGGVLSAPLQLESFPEQVRTRPLGLATAKRKSC